MKIIYISFLLTFKSATCGKLPIVFGGSPASEGQFPYQISIQTPDGRHACGGAIYNKRWVITANHCIIDGLRGFSIVVGLTELGQGTRYDIADTIRYNDMEDTDNDIALIKVTQDIDFNDDVKPIPISEEDVGENIDAAVSGWGTTENGQSSSLMFTALKTINNEDCEEKWSFQASVEILQQHICTTSPYGVGTCHGDSGGPLAADGKLIGVVSLGWPCAKGVPDVFTRVSKYKDWIKEKTGTEAGTGMDDYN